MLGDLGILRKSQDYKLFSFGLMLMKLLQRWQLDP